MQVTNINSAPVQDVTDNHLSSEVEEALHIFVEEILPNVNFVTQAATLNQEIIPNLSKLIHEFTIDNEASTGLGLADLENGMAKIVEEVLSKSLQCTGGQDMTNSSLVQSITDDLTSKRVHNDNCFQLNTRLSGTDIGGSVIKKIKEESDLNCQESCKDHPECNFFLYFTSTSTHYQTWKRGECRLLRFQGQYQPNQKGHTSGPSECDKVDSQDNYDQLKAFLTRTSDETLDLECSRLARARQEGRSLLKELENHVKLNVFSGAEKEDMESFRNGVFYAIDAVRHLWVELLQSAVGNCVQLHIPSSTLHAEYCKLMTSKSAKNIRLTMMLHCLRRLKIYICILIGFHIIWNRIIILTIDV